MPTRNISLTAEQDAFVEELVNAGEYQNASEAVRDALRALERRRREDVLRLKALRLQIKAGAAAIKRGDFAEIDEGDLERYLERDDDDSALVAAGLMRKGTGKLPASFWRTRGPRVPLDVAVAAVSADRDED